MESANQSKKPRNFSLDLLRIISMTMIIFLHACSHGGLLENLNVVNPLGVTIRLIDSLCLVSVNIYVLISGYFLCEEDFRISKLLKIIFETLFYSWLVLLAFVLTSHNVVSLRAAIFPISFSQNWFITAYIGMYLVFPFMNIILSNSSRKQHMFYIALSMIIFVFWYDIIPTSNPFNVAQGATFIWFCALYIIAVYIRKYIKNINGKKMLLVYAVCSCITTLSWVLLHSISNRITAIKPLENWYYRYNSIFVVIASVALFTVFLNIKIKNNIICRVIKFVSPLTLGVYLIHDNPNIRNILWNTIIDFNRLKINAWFLFKLVFIVIAIFAISMLIDYLRLLLFKLIEKNKYYRLILNKLDNFFMRKFSGV